MAIMRQQGKFVMELYSSGMVDEQEEEQLMEPISKQERRLVRNGAVWRAPRIPEVRGTALVNFAQREER